MRCITDTHARPMAERQTGEVVESSELDVVMQPALWHEVQCVLKQRFIATDAVQVRLTVRLQREIIRTQLLLTWQPGYGAHNKH